MKKTDKKKEIWFFMSKDRNFSIFLKVKSLLKKTSNFFIKGSIFIFIEAYRQLVRPFLCGNCRFSPSCSCYVKEALLKHGCWGGTLLSVKRVVRCWPFCKYQYDPVPGER